MKDPRLRAARRFKLWLLMVALLVIAGCCTEPVDPPPQFPGLYDVTRGTAQLKIGFLLGESEGETTQEAGGGELVPIDPNDVPFLFRPLAELWNQALDDINADLDELFPNQVIVSHPNAWLTKVESPEDHNEFFQGVNGPNGFLAVAAGGGADPNLGLATLGAAAVTGKWDGVDTINGELSLILSLGGGGQQGGGLLTIAIVVPYDAVLVPE